MAEHASRNDRLYFQAHGLTPKAPKALNKALQHAIDSMHRTLYGPSAGELTASELELLERSGMDADEHPQQSDPLMTYATEFAAILATSLSAAQAAQRLRGITPVRVRQMIRDGALYACRVEGRWKIPVFQFDDSGLVPNIGNVNTALPKTLDPVSVLRWYTTPDAELTTRDGEVSSPLDWLKAGGDPRAVEKIAADL